MKDATNITKLVNEAGAGGAEARELVVLQVYGELRRLASYYLHRERPGHPWSTTDLINEMYLKLFHSSTPLSVNDRNHFFAVAATQLRRVLVDYAREGNAGKRKGMNVEFNELFHGTGDADRNLIALDDALQSLGREDAEAHRIVELRFFGGFTYEEVAEMENTNVSHVRRTWDFARAWLEDHMGLP